MYIILFLICTTMNTIKLIKTPEQYQEALNHLETIFDAKPNTPEWEELELLWLLIENYEKKQVFIDTPDPIEAIKFRMEQMNISISDLGKILWYKSRASEILHHKRKLTISMIRNLSKKLNISPSILIQTY